MTTLTAAQAKDPAALAEKSSAAKTQQADAAQTWAAYMATYLTPDEAELAKSAAADMDAIRLGKAHRARQTNGEIGHPPAVSFGFPVAQIECQPALVVI